MANFLRLVSIILGIFFCSSSFAVTFYASGYIFSTPKDACSYQGTLGSPPWAFGNFVDAGNYGKCYDSQGVYQVNIGYVFDKATSCPSGYTLDPTTSTCIAAAACTAGKTVTGNIPYPGSAANICSAGCEATIKDASNFCTDKSCTTQVWSGSWITTGNACVAGAPTVTQGNCPPGQVSGTFNGETLCLPGGKPPVTQSSSTTPETTSQKNPDNSTTTTSTSTTTNCSGDGSCTSTTTTTVNQYPPGVTPGPGVTPTSTSTTSKTDQAPVQSFCADHPSDPSCKAQTGSFAGVCGSLPPCTGDPVQCATAQATWSTNCTLNPSSGSISDLGNQAVSGSDPLAGTFPNSPSNLNTVDVGTVISGSANTRWLGSGDLTNPSFVVLGHSFTLDLGLFSRFLRAIGYVFVAVAGVVAARILGS